MTYGWNTHKTDTGFNWAITCTVYDEDADRGFTTIVKAGNRSTYAKASSMAKRWCLYFRRGGK